GRSGVIHGEDAIPRGLLPEMCRLQRKPPTLEYGVHRRVTIVRGAAAISGPGRAAHSIGVPVVREADAKRQCWMVTALQIPLDVVVDGPERTELQTTHDQGTRLFTVAQVGAPASKHADSIGH